jgi:poly(3-hydroxybutyrate) depolymerase
MLIEPESASSKTPLVVFVHGSEKTGWVGKSAMPYMFAAQGISHCIASHADRA